MSVASEAWQVALMAMSDTTQPLIQVWYDGDDRADTTPTITIDNNGATSTLDIALTDNTGTLNLAGTATASHTTVATLQALVDAINARRGTSKYGWHAVRYNGPADYPLNTDDFIDIAATEVPATPTNFLYRDVSEILTSNLRLSNPETGDEGEIEIALVQGNATYGSGAVTGKMSIDQGTTAAEELQFFAWTAAATTVESTPYDGLSSGSPIRVRGPVLIEITGSAALSALAYRVMWRPVN